MTTTCRSVCVLAIPMIALACGGGGGDRTGGDEDAGVARFDATADAPPVDAAAHDAGGACPAIEWGADAGPLGGSPHCDPLSQEGCGAGEKCTWIQTGPAAYQGRTACVRDGDVGIGDACTATCIPEGSTAIGEPCSEDNQPDPGATPIIGTDDCAGAGICTRGRCRSTCSPSCEASCDSLCEYSYPRFDDLSTTLGACSQPCDPVAQTCGGGLGCYAQEPYAAVSTCEIAGDAELVQGTPCPAGACTFASCAPGLGPWLDGDGGSLCTTFSTSIDTYLDDPDGDGVGTLIGNSVGPAGADCGEARIGVTAHQSRFLQGFLGDNETPDTLGICVPIGAEYGDCEEYSLEFLIRTYDEAEADPDPPSGNQAIDALCAATERCGRGCVSDATWLQLAIAYCDRPEHADSAWCFGG
jgi:hypothetical protein